MRIKFVETLRSLASQDPDLWLVCGDLGFSVLEPFASEFAKRFLNAGVAEQNMTGIAAGLALTGKKVFTYSIANFPIIRCLEQIRNDVCQHNLPVKIVAVGGGLAYGYAGYSHHSMEDIAIARTLPGMRVLVPADPLETELCTRYATAYNGPVFLRIGKGGDPILHKENPPTSVENPIVVREGKDAAIITSGSILAEALSAADSLAKHGLSIKVISCPLVAPFPAKGLSSALGDIINLFSVEEHVAHAGLGGAVAECLSDESSPKRRLHRLGISFDNSKKAGSLSHLRKLNGIDAESISKRVLESISEKHT